MREQVDRRACVFVPVQHSGLRASPPRVLTALPPSDKARTEELAALVGRETRGMDRVVLQERIELGHELEQVSERDEGPVERPRRAWHGPQCLRVDVAVAADEHHALWDCLLPGVQIGVEALHGRLRDAVEEAEAIHSGGQLMLFGGLWSSRRLTAHDPYSHWGGHCPSP